MAKTPASGEIETELGQKGLTHIVGLDEAGRGPWAGPIVAGAALIHPNLSLPPLYDSKMLNEEERSQLRIQVLETCQTGIGIVTAAEIDKIGLGAANRLVFFRAFEALLQNHPSASVHYVAIDGNPIKHADFKLPVGFSCIQKGEQKSIAIAAASILAKTTRDALMVELGKLHPQYGFETHKGYGTATHQKAILTHGVLPNVHRTSFAPIKNLLKP
jgi:ribonuclease HII